VDEISPCKCENILKRFLKLPSRPKNKIEKTSTTDPSSQASRPHKKYQNGRNSVLHVMEYLLQTPITLVNYIIL